MRIANIIFIVVSSIFLFSCGSSRKAAGNEPAPRNNNSNTTPVKRKTFTEPLNIDRDEFVSFAKTLLGTPYKYGSSVPSKGLDCSGFIYHVFAHFNIKAPRSSADFTNEGTSIDPSKAKPGDIILFTGSDNSSGVVGHMGIITENKKELKFIHSASGRSVGVIINSWTGYYKTHFVKVIRILQ